jgi:alkylhydroperoxidase family enzyme
VPKLDPIPLAEMDERTRDLLTALDMGDGSEPLAIFGTLAHHPKLLGSWLPFGGRLLAGGELDRRLTELVILRTAYNVGSDYEWGQHVRMCEDLGIEREAIERIPFGPGADGWSPVEALVLKATDELHADRRVHPDTFDVLGTHFDDRQRIELCFLVGHYEMVAMALKTLEVEPDAHLDLERLPSSQ